MNRRRPTNIDALNRNWVKLGLLNLIISVSVSLIVILSFGNSEKQIDMDQFQDQVTTLHQEISKVILLVLSFFQSKYLHIYIAILLGLPLHKSKRGFIRKKLQKMRYEFFERNSIEATKISIANSASTSTTPNPDQSSTTMVAKNTKLIKSNMLFCHCGTISQTELK